ncbi:hypothetical protein ACLB2K_006878 [Fragaria x ananassa]
MFAAALASQSALGWGDSLLSVAGRCPGESIRAWLGTIAMWRVSGCLIGDCRYVALRPMHGESVRAWLGTVAMWRCGRCVASQSALGRGDSLLSVAGRCPGESVSTWLGTVAMWRVSARLIGDCRYVALRPLHGESVRAWLGRLAIERCGRCPGESIRAWLGTVAMWRVSARLIGDCRYVALQSFRGESVRAWLGRLAIESYGRCPGESVHAWLGTVAMWRVSARLIGDCRYVALRPLRGESVRAWLGRLTIERCRSLPWRVSPRLVGDCRYVALWPLRGESVFAWLGRFAIESCGRCPSESVRAWLGTVAMWRAKLGYLGLSLQCGTACYPLECLPFWGCFAARVTLASGLLPALHSLDAREGLARAISTG